MFPQITGVFPHQEIIDRTTTNCWEDDRVVSAFKKTGRKKLVLAGLLTEVCIAMPAIQAIKERYEVYIVADACGGTITMAHDIAMERTIQAGAVPIAWLPILLELQRGWAHLETYKAVISLAMEDAGTYGMGMSMLKQC